ncbi:MAG: site-specific DNA-methyltransferase [Desulfamplus sp.]|nr:site-specific DNA-methyltransferase [Desulfamplus sp.]
MAKKKQSEREIEQYDHKGKDRPNIPPIGLVTPESDPETGAKKTYQYDPHLDPQLQWAGKAEHTSFEVPTVSLHVHERIDPKTIIESVKKEIQDNAPVQMSLFDDAREKPLREAIEFYKHKENWSNRLIAGDSLLVMNSLLEKEGMAGKVQMLYFDPPYGIKYGSNFQPFVNKRDVKDGKDEDLSAEPEMIKAFRDTWELGIHSYLTYLRDRLLLARELLTDSGSVFVQISDENVHHVREILDEVFGAKNFHAQINYRSMSPLGHAGMAQVYDYIIWYTKNNSTIKYNPIFREQRIEDESEFCFLDDGRGNYKKLPHSEILQLSKEDKKLVFKRSDLHSSGYGETCDYIFDFEGEQFHCGKKSWRTHYEGMLRLIQKNRLFRLGKSIYFRQYHSDYPVMHIENSWHDTAAGYSETKKYVVETTPKAIQRCLLMTTDPGDLVLDITCGSGTTAYVAEQWGRRWITCDTSRVALTLAKQRLMTANFDYYQLAHQKEGVSSGFVYKTVPHITLKSIANNEPPATETLYDQPLIERNKTRITGPFTVEAVPSPHAKSFDDLENDDNGSDTSIARTGETLRQSEWRDELFKSGVRAKGGQIMKFIRLEPLGGTKYIHCEGELETENSILKTLVVFGPEHAPLERRMVENAWQEARLLKTDILLFCAFQFDEEAAREIDDLIPRIAGMQLLKVLMNADLFTDDLRKKRSSNQSFWLIGQPDVKVHKLKDGKVQVEVMGFDYYNPKTGSVESGGKKNIAIWMLDTDYDSRSLFPTQIFFPMAGSGDGWDKLAKNLKAEIDDEKIEAFKGTVSLPFKPKSSIAVKIIDDRGIESLRVIRNFELMGKK